MQFYMLGNTMTPRAIILQAYGELPHPFITQPVEYKRLMRDGLIAYELAKGTMNGEEWWGVFFARVVNGHAIRMPDESKCFTAKSMAKDWIDTMERTGGTIS